MAEERNLATVRATETPDGDDATKEELQRRMEEARESITQTVAEIKDTVTNQYQAVRETVTEALDWREQFRKRPMAFSIGALSIGFCVGYSLAGAFKGDGRDYYDYEEEAEPGTASAGGYYSRGEARQQTGRRKVAPPSYAAQAITGSSYGSSTGASGLSPSAYGSSAAEASVGAEAEADQGPGLIERFKSTKAYDRLEEEVSALGDRFLNELSKTAQAVVLPALFGKVKELFGVDLSTKEGEGRTAQQHSGGSSSVGSTTGGSVGRESSAGGGSSYATSENRGYGAAAGGGDYGRGSD